MLPRNAGSLAFWLAVPQGVPIAREAGCRIDTIGRYRDGQFYAAVQHAHRDDDHPRDRKRGRVRWYAYLHLFDADGNHRESEISLIGIAPYLKGGLGALATARLASLLGELEEAESGAIAIRPFTLIYDGVSFGLIHESTPGRGNWAQLYPRPARVQRLLGRRLQHMTPARSRITKLYRTTHTYSATTVSMTLLKLLPTYYKICIFWTRQTPGCYPEDGAHNNLSSRENLQMAESRCQHGGTSSPVQSAIRIHVSPGLRMPTPTGRATFIVHDLNREGIILLFGPKRTPTRLTWDCLEGIPEFLRNRGWMRVGANRDVNGNPGTLDAYLKRCLKRQTADYVAVVLERAGIVELDRERPARIRLARRP